MSQFYEPWLKIVTEFLKYSVEKIQFCEIIEEVTSTPNSSTN